MTATAPKEARVSFTVRMPWLLRNRCHDAAKKAGMTVNEWMLHAVENFSEPGGMTNKPGRRSDEFAAILAKGKSNAPD